MNLDPDRKFKMALIKDIATLLSSPIEMLTLNDIFSPWVPNEKVGRYRYCGGVQWQREVWLKGWVTHEFFDLTMKDAFFYLELLQLESLESQSKIHGPVMRLDKENAAYRRIWHLDLSMGSLQHPGMVRKEDGSTLHYFLSDEYPGIWRVNEALERRGRIQRRTFYQCKNTGIHFSAIKRLLSELNSKKIELEIEQADEYKRSSSSSRGVYS